MTGSKVERKLLHYTGKAIARFNLIEKNDRVLVCLSGGKDSFTLLKILSLLQRRAKINFELQVLAVDQGLVGWQPQVLASWLEDHGYSFAILETEISKVKAAKHRPKVSPCVLCSRLRRGYIYTYAKKHCYHKVALGHHREDLITSLLMSICYSGKISSMPPKLITQDQRLTVIRPLAFCQENDIATYASEQHFPVVVAGQCPASEYNIRKEVGRLISELAIKNPKVPSNILHALQQVQLSQLMDNRLYDFKNLAAISSSSAEEIEEL